MSVHQTGLVRVADLVLGASDWRYILINHPSSFDYETDMAEIIRYECIQETGGYQPASYTYTAGTTTYDATDNRAEAPAFNAQFSAPGAGSSYSHTHLLMINGRGANANKQIGSVNAATDVLTCVGHGLTDGDRVVITATGALPAGLTIQRYYVNSLTADTFELYTDAGLTAKALFTDTGSGTLYLRYANGSLGPYVAASGSISPGQTKTFQVNHYFPAV